MSLRKIFRTKWTDHIVRNQKRTTPAGFSRPHGHGVFSGRDPSHGGPLLSSSFFRRVERLPKAPRKPLGLPECITCAPKPQRRFCVTRSDCPYDFCGAFAVFEGATPGMPRIHHVHQQQPANGEVLMLHCRDCW
jgi:hypothetical protein